MRRALLLAAALAVALPVYAFKENTQPTATGSVAPNVQDRRRQLLAGTEEEAPAAWTPADADGLVAWWDLTSTTYVSVSGSNVTGVTDRSGNGHDLNVISATPPTFNATAFGASVGGVDFVAASSTYLLRESAPVAAAPFQIYMVAIGSDATVAGTPFWLGDKDAAADAWYVNFSGTTGGDPVTLTVADNPTFASADTTTGFTANATHLVWFLETSSTSRAIRIDGAGEGTNTTDSSPDTADRIGLGAYTPNTPASFFSGSIAEVVIINTDSVADRASFHTYFADKYGITLP